MNIINITQGCAEWHAYRAKHFNASDCPAMLGISSYKSRDALLKEKATGIAPEIDSNTQRIFDKGHEYEEMARPLAEAFLGDELYPIVASLDVDGLPLSASLDGLTMIGETAWEHKTLNGGIEASLKIGEIPEQYRAQMEMQLLVSGAERCLFMASRGTAETVMHQFYESDAAMRERIIQGWKQFAIDLASYVVPEAEAPKAIAEPVATLPAISFKTEFMGNKLVLTSNLNAYKAAASKLVEQSKEVLKTDQDFANAEARIKSCKSAEEKIAAIQSSVLGEVADIDLFVKELAAIAEILRQCRLNEDKQVKARKEAIKYEELTRASNEWNAVIVGYNEKLWKSGKVQMPSIRVDFQGAIKGLKTVASLRSKLNDEIARGKIEASAVYEQITDNLQLLNMIAGEYMELFADLQNLCTKDADYIKAIAAQRVNDHKAAEQNRIQAEAMRIANEQIERDRKALEPVTNTETIFTRKEREEFDVTADMAYEPPKVLSDYHRGHMDGKREGVIAGLDLAIAIFMKHGEKGFVKAVEDFIEVGAPEEAMKAA